MFRFLDYINIYIYICFPVILSSQVSNHYILIFKSILTCLFPTMVEHITFFEGFDLYVVLLMEHPHRSLPICHMDIKLYMLSKA
jgi:hypothetical protein